jgi:GH15 family glucan-1,4-alpha-glucosidase
VLEQPVTLILGVDEPLQASVPDTARRFYESTLDYWHEWVRYLSIPFEWQEAVIRAAITLKLCNFEESGGIVAAATTSVPEAPDSGRNWDYRFCWLRDAYFVVHALNRLGATRTLEDYSTYITNIVAASDGKALQPVYGVSLESRLVERTIESLSGYRGMGPVRAGNAAYSQVQHDVYGSVILASTQLFFDQRIMRPGTREHFDRLERLGQLAAANYDQPDAGLWEYRGRTRVHTFSSVMSWAACDRLAKIAACLGLPERTEYWRRSADAIRQAIVDRAWRPEQNTFVESFEGRDLDASLLLMHELGFLGADDPRFVGTVTAIEQRLRRGSYMMRYDAHDDFGAPETSFTVCTFWYIDALAAIGRREEARELFENVLARRNHLGLLSEDIDPKTGALWGNFPQTYSMVGLINSAMRLSKSWEAAF